MRLTFQNGQFELHDLKSYTLLSGSDWKLDGSIISPGAYTTSIVAALKFRLVADEKAERIFTRVLVKHYSPPKLESLPDWLDPHQKEGVAWVLSRSRSYLAHAPGAGKTCQAIVSAFLTKATPGQAVFIVPPSLTRQWEREIVQWHSRLLNDPKAWPYVSIVPESKRKDFTGWGADYLIVPDSMLAKDWVQAGLSRVQKRFVAVDEASRFKESTALRTIALFGGLLPVTSTKKKIRVRGLIHQAKHAVLMDGSPMPNRPMELWAPTYAMSPETIGFMDQTEFGFRYCGATMNDYGRWEFRHSKNEAELKDKLQSAFMHVVPESQLNHPERLRSMLFINEDKRDYTTKRWEAAALKTLRIEDIGESQSQGTLASARQEIGMSKVDWVARYVAERLRDKNESILLFAWHRSVIVALQTALKKFEPRVIMGATLKRHRDLYVSDFQAGRSKLLILNIAAAGRGLNLQKADRVIFAEYSWTNETNTQAEKRASRKGSDKAFVRCEYAVLPDSLDEVVLKAVFKKAERVRKVIGE